MFKIVNTQLYTNMGDLNSTQLNSAKVY